MISIGQFSKICQISVKTLHHYDKIQLMPPFYVDKFTGYRYYDESQIPTMLLIQRLKFYGFPLSDIRYLLSCQNEKTLYMKLESQERVLRQQMEETSIVLGELKKHLSDFERTGDIMGYQNNYEIAVKTTESMNILSSRQMMAVAEFGLYYGKLYEKIMKEHLTPCGFTLAIYHDEEFNQENSDIELAVMIKEEDKATRTLPSSLCASTIHKGAYSSLSDAYGAIVRWIEQNDYEVDGCPFEIYLKNQFDELPVEEWETEIYFPIKEK